MRQLENLEPQRVFYYFEELSKIPHGSGNTDAISSYLCDFAKEHGLKCIKDSKNNVIIFKDASKDCTSDETLILQGHMDMVCEKEKGVEIDFEKDPLELYVDGDFVKAKGTTLGGDDGIALAYALAILESDSIKHPALEVVITVDEEVGMLGAYDLDFSMLKGRKLLNIDSDVEGVFLTGCAGGLCLISHIPVSRVNMKGLLYEISVTGLIGGHSGAEIHKERANSNIMMGRLLSALQEQTPFGIKSLAGGLKDNAIPRETTAVIMLPEESEEDFLNLLSELKEAFIKEYAISDPDIDIDFKKLPDNEAMITNSASTTKIVFYLRQTPNGVMHMSTAMEGIVETSLNLGILELKDEELYSVTSIRSSVNERKKELRERLQMLVEMLGGCIDIEGEYPAWEYRMESELRDEIAEAYRDLYQKNPDFTAIHAGLECGIFSEKLQGLDAVSFGPMNLDIHTPRERLSVSSTQRVWNFLLHFLEKQS